VGKPESTLVQGRIDGIAGSVRITEIPMLDCAGLPCLEMTAGSGKTLRLLIDTGDINSYIDKRVAQNLGLALEGLKGTGGDAASPVEQSVLSGAKLGDLPMGDFPFMVLDTTPQGDPQGKQSLPLPGDGVLTFSAFKARLLQLDYGRHLVRVSEPQDSAPVCPHTCSDLVIKRFGGFGPATLTTKGFSVDGQPVDVQLDTTFTGTMLIYPEAAKQLGLKKKAKAKHSEVFPFTQGGVKLVRADGATEAYERLTLLEDAPIYFWQADQPAPSVRFDGTVGSGLLSRGVVTFDFKGMHMWMERAPR
jgi:hypothetical protein